MTTIDIRELWIDADRSAGRPPTGYEERDFIRQAADRAARGREARTRIQAQTGVDPTQTPEARARRSRSLAADRAVRGAWENEHAGEIFDTQAFQRDVIPLLASVPLSQIVSVTGISDSAASRIRRGLRSPHPRHWKALGVLAEGQAVPPKESLVDN